jgi:hypothetical protein
VQVGDDVKRRPHLTLADLHNLEGWYSEDWANARPQVTRSASMAAPQSRWLFKPTHLMRPTLKPGIHWTAPWTKVETLLHAAPSWCGSPPERFIYVENPAATGVYDPNKVRRHRHEMVALRCLVARAELPFADSIPGRGTTC